MPTSYRTMRAVADEAIRDDGADWASLDAWLDDRRRAGWSYGRIRDALRDDYGVEVTVQTVGNWCRSRDAVAAKNPAWATDADGNPF